MPGRWLMGNQIDRCLGCDRDMRPARTTISAYPGTIVRHNRTTCRTCWRRKKSGFDPVDARCQHCGRGIRPSRTLLSEAPGTVLGTISRRVCQTCDKDPSILRRLTEKTSAPKKSRLRRCQGCCQMTRPNKTRKEDYPNTVARYNSRLCVSCWERENRGLPWWEMEARGLEVFPVSEEEKIAAARAVIRFGGDMLVLEALGLKDVYAEVR